MKAIQNIVCGAVSLCAAYLFGAVPSDFTGTVRYVDGGNLQTGDGSAGNPFQSIQAAIDVASAGDRVVIAAGTYDTGKTESVLGETSSYSRVVLNKRLYLKAEGGDVVIRGQDAVDADEYGDGSNAVRCMLATEDAADSLLEGLTFTGGRTCVYDPTLVESSSSAPNFRQRLAEGVASSQKLAIAGRNVAATGGGLYFRGWDRAHPLMLVDCTFSDCRAGFAGGAVYGPVVMVRNYVTTSYAYAVSGGAVTRIVGAFSSVFSGNGRTLRDCSDTVHGADDLNYTHYSTFVNCTFNGNLGGGMPLAEGSNLTAPSWAAAYCQWFYNCIFFVHGEGLRHVNGYVEAYHCCQNKYGSLKNGGAGNIGTDYSPRLNEDNLPFGYNQFVSGYGRDCRLREGSYLLDKGNNDYIAQKAAFVPEFYRDKDFYGQARIQDGVVDQGAAEGGYATNGCVLVVSSRDGDTAVPYSFNGCRVDDVFSGLRISGQEGESVELAFDIPDGRALYGLVTDTVVNHPWSGSTTMRYLYPEFQGASVRFLLESAEKYPTAQYNPKFSTPTWVSPDGQDSEDTALADGSEAKPYKTLQYAYSKDASAYGVIYAKAGTYDEGGVDRTTAVDADWSQDTGSRLQIMKPLRIVGVEGAERTIIKGQPSTLTVADKYGVNNGCGTGAKRCIAVSSRNYVKIQGFTLTDGHVASAPWGRSYDYQVAMGKNAKKSADNLMCLNFSGGAVVGAGYNIGCRTVEVADCIVSNNVAYHGSAFNSVIARRCVVTDNASPDPDSEPLLECAEYQGSPAVTNIILAKSQYIGYLAANTVFSHCLVYGNDRMCTNSADTVRELINQAYNSGALINSTVAETSHIPFSGSGYVYNTVVLGAPGFRHVGNAAGNVVWPNADGWTQGSPERYVVADPGCMDTACGRFRIAAVSPAATAGVPIPADDETLRMLFYEAFTEGLNGGEPEWNHSPCVAGCYQDFVRYVGRVSAVGNRGVAPMGVFGADTAGDATGLTLTATDAETRHFLGFAIDGKVVCSDITYVAPAPYRSPFAGSGALNPEVVAMYSTDWYVNAEIGSDANNGWAPDTPKKTLVGAMAHVLSGDVVHAAPGTYRDGSTKHAEMGWNNDAIAVVNRTRCVIPSGVSLIADGSRTNTFIEGVKVAGSPSFPYYDLFNGGFSPDAVRGVAMYPNSYLKGFTVTNCSLDVSSGCPNSDNTMGAGILCKDLTAVIEDCAVTECAAKIGACSLRGTYRRCRFTRGLALVDGGGSACATCHQCFFDRLADGMVYDMRGLCSCTFGPNNKYFGFTTGTVPSRIERDSVAIENCLFLASTEKTNSYAHADNCIFAYRYDPGQVQATGVGNVLVQYEELLAKYGSIADDYAPAADAPSVDTGCDTTGAEKDVAGNPRVLNGQVDVGCYEYDWRGEFALALGVRRGRLTVTDVGGQTVLVDGQLILKDTLSTVWKTSGSMVTVTVEVLGEGSLTLLRGEEQVGVYTKAGGVQTIRIPGTESRLVPQNLRFEYASNDANDAGAKLSDFKDQIGMALIVR